LSVVELVREDAVDLSLVQCVLHHLTKAGTIDMMEGGINVDACTWQRTGYKARMRVRMYKAKSSERTVGEHT
jgi:hypothetical protein